MNKKTNVMRILDANKVSYNFYYYGDTDALSGIDVATVLKQDFNRVFKTLIAVGKSKTYYVFVVPVNKELNLKKAAKSVGEKQIEMVTLNELFPLTGYVHGGCSPIGLKKSFITVVDETAGRLDRIIFSAGKVGYQVELSLLDLSKIIDYTLADIVSR